MTKRPGFQVDQIDHVEFFVPDRYEAAAWYDEVLGVGIVEDYKHWADDPHGPLMISPDGGNTKLALFQGTPQGGRETVGYHLVAFRVGAGAFIEFLKRAVVHGLKSPRGEPVTLRSAVDHDRAYSVYFVDPYGHRLEVTTYEYDAASNGLATLDSEEGP